MNMPSMKRTLKAMAKPSINMANISGSDLARVLLPVPPLPLQRGYLALRRTVDSLREQYRRAARETATLFDSLAYDAFRGEFTGGGEAGNPQLGRFGAGEE